MQHSKIVGGSTAKRVINCPGSVALVQQMPPQPSSKYAQEGTMLHDAISQVLLGAPTVDVLSAELTQELFDEKIVVALELLDEIDPKKELIYEVETRVGFGDLLPGVFGSTDLVGRLGNRAIVLDWKFVRTGLRLLIISVRLTPQPLVRSEQVFLPALSATSRVNSWT